MPREHDTHQFAKEQEVIERAADRLAAKRARAVARIQELAPHAPLLIGMLDEMKVDLLLIALGGATVEVAP